MQTPSQADTVPNLRLNSPDSTHHPSQPMQVPAPVPAVDRPLAPLLLLLMALLLSVGAGSCAREERTSGAGGATSAKSGKGELLADRSGATRGARPSPGADKAAPLKVLSAALATIDEKYVAPSRIHPGKMFDKALEFVEAERAELRITGGSKTGSVLVRVGAQARKFSLGPMSTVAMLYVQLKTILGFVREAVTRRGGATAKELAELEYAAVNGIVSTLDPHSVLMPPKVYGEMRIRTRGAFGGVGIVISIRDGKLTVISPIDDTPAARAGIRAGDHIAKIGDESTVNMPLREAVSRLRGKPGTLVTFWVAREGWHEERRFDIVRSRIEIKSVSSKVLPGRVGYLRINRFSHNTTDELKDHLRKLKGAGVKGLILDMWNNPGGLLQQAEMVADAFLSEGNIVITEAARKVVLRVRKASADTTLFQKPMLVLVNRGSASAAEIVAGALKNLWRAVLLGETTFGKGTVQMLFDNPDGSALKMTVAQYLTPGNQSIQTVGIQPDVLTSEVLLRKGWTRLFGHEADERRRAKRKDLLPARATHAGRPIMRLDYLSPDSDGSAKARHHANVGANAAPAPLVELARLLLARYAGTRPQMLLAMRPFLRRWGREQQRKIVAALRRRKVDWAEAPAGAQRVKAASIRAEVKVGGALPVAAGSKVKLELKVTNSSSSAVHRVWARTEAPSYVLDERELLVGLLGPGQTRTATITVKIPPHMRSSIQPVRLVLSSPQMEGELRLKTRVPVKGLPRPFLSLSYGLHDDVKGNGDGRPELGETVRVRVKVRNSGTGSLRRGGVALRNLAGHGVNVIKGRVTLDKLSPGSSREVDLTLRIEPTLKKRKIKLELSVYDLDLRASLQGHLILPIAPKTASAPGLVGEISPPRITVSKVPLSVSASSRYVQVSGVASDENRVQDLFVEVTNFDAQQVRHKVFYAASPKGGKRLPFKARVPLWSGVNRILIVARENGEVMGYRRILVTRP